MLIVRHNIAMKNTTRQKQVFKAEYFQQKGLNIHAIFDLAELPADVIDSINAAGVNSADYKQLILIGHLGQSLWHKVKRNIGQSTHVIDDYSVDAVQKYFKQYHSAHSFKVLYPDNEAENNQHSGMLALQKLGTLTGWHFSSPFKVGINKDWGSWFAYRAVVLADTNFTQTQALASVSPCVDCYQKNCLAACPSKALENAEMNFQSCIEYRKTNDSACKKTCMARVACPVAQQYRYSEEQLAYHYGVSMQTIEALY